MVISNCSQNSSSTHSTSKGIRCDRMLSYSKSSSTIMDQFSIPSYNNRASLYNRLTARELNSSCPSSLSKVRQIVFDQSIRPVFQQEGADQKLSDVPGYVDNIQGLKDINKANNKSEGLAFIKNILSGNSDETGVKLGNTWVNPNLLQGQHSLSGSSSYSQRRRFHLDTPPRISVSNVKSVGIPRKFSPDGRYLIVFSQNMHAVQVYYYKGPKIPRYLIPEIDKFYKDSLDTQLSETDDNLDFNIEPLSGFNCKSFEKSLEQDLLNTQALDNHRFEVPIITNLGYNTQLEDGRRRTDSDNVDVIRSESLFLEMFDLKYETSICSGNEWLCRDFCLFISNFELEDSLDDQYLNIKNKSSFKDSTNSTKYIILASAEPAESRGVDNINVDNITLWSVNLETGKIVSSYQLPNDFVYLTNQSGVHCYGNLLCVTSVQFQCTYIFKVDLETGKISKVKTIGSIGNDDDCLLLQQQESSENIYKTKLEKSLLRSIARTLSVHIAEHTYIGKTIRDTVVDSKISTDDILKGVMPESFNKSINAENKYFDTFDSRSSFSISKSLSSMLIPDEDVNYKDTQTDELCIPTSPTTVMGRSSKAAKSFTNNFDNEVDSSDISGSNKDDDSSDDSSIAHYSTASEGINSSDDGYEFDHENIIEDVKMNHIYDLYDKSVKEFMKKQKNSIKQEKVKDMYISKKDAYKYRSVRVNDALCNGNNLVHHDLKIPNDVSNARKENCNIHSFLNNNFVSNDNIENNDDWYSEVLKYCRLYGKHSFRLLLDSQLVNYINGELSTEYKWLIGTISRADIDAAWMSIVTSLLFSRRKVLLEQLSGIKDTIDSVDGAVLRQISDLRKRCLVKVGSIGEKSSFDRALNNDEDSRIKTDGIVLQRILKSIIGTGSLDEIESVTEQSISVNADSYKIRSKRKYDELDDISDSDKFDNEDESKIPSIEAADYLTKKRKLEIIGAKRVYTLQRKNARKMKKSRPLSMKVDIERVYHEAKQHVKKQLKRKGKSNSLNFDSLFHYDSPFTIGLFSESKYYNKTLSDTFDMPSFKDSQYDTTEHRNMYLPSLTLRLLAISLDLLGCDLDTDFCGVKSNQSLKEEENFPLQFLYGSVAPRKNRNKSTTVTDSNSSLENSESSTSISDGVWNCNQGLICMHLPNLLKSVGAGSLAVKLSQCETKVCKDVNLNDSNSVGAGVTTANHLDSSDTHTNSRTVDSVGINQDIESNEQSSNSASWEDKAIVIGEKNVATSYNNSKSIGTCLRESSLFFGLGYDLFPGLMEPIESNIKENNYIAKTINNETKKYSWQLLKHLAFKSSSLENNNNNTIGITQKMLTFLYRKALETDESELEDTNVTQLGYKSLTALRLFFANVTQIEQLSMWRAHFIDSDNILIKLGNKGSVLGRLSEGSYTSNLIYFVVYSLSSSEVVGVFDNNNEEFLKMYLKSPQLAGIKSLRKHSQNTLSAPCNSKFALESALKQINFAIKSRNGGPTSAIRRTLSHLPLNEQCVYESPYLDVELFSYDERYVTANDRPRVPSEQPTKFFSRIDGGLTYNLVHNTSSSSRRPIGDNNRTQKKPINWIFHPTDPFVIGVSNNDMNTDIVIHGI